MIDISNAALMARRTPQIGQSVFTYGIHAVSIPDSKYPLGYRIEFHYKIIQAHVWDVGITGTDLAGNPEREVRLEVPADQMRLLDEWDLTTHRNNGWIARSNLGWFATEDEARARTAWVEANAPEFTHHLEN